MEVQRIGYAVDDVEQPADVDHVDHTLVGHASPPQGTNVVRADRIGLMGQASYQPERGPELGTDGRSLGRLVAEVEDGLGDLTTELSRRDRAV